MRGPAAKKDKHSYIIVMKKKTTPIKSNYPMLEFIVKEFNKKGSFDEGNFILAFMSDMTEPQVPYELKFLHQRGYIQVWRDDSGYRIIKPTGVFPQDYQGVRLTNKLF
jgi:hypothetical protein